MTPAERLIHKRAYATGYNAGRRNAWPDHKPPAPPALEVTAVVAAARNLRDELDGLLAGLDPNDPWEERLAPKIAAVDRALAGVSEWLKRPEEPA